MKIETIKISEEERELLFHFYGEDIGTEVDFNRLMPVVEKISNIGWMVQIQIDPGFKDVAACIIAHRTKIISFKDSTLLEATHKAVVEFIKWYKTQPHDRRRQNPNRRRCY